jgi:hypothetical protein
MNWTLAHIEALKKAGKIRGYKILGKDPDKPSARKPKFRNKKVEYEGIVFDSRKEYSRYRELLLLQKAGKIGQLRLQVRFLLIEANEKEKKCEYIADFVYVDTVKGVIVEDVKSEATRKLPTYIMKRKLMKSVHNIEIREV